MPRILLHGPLLLPALACYPGRLHAFATPFVTWGRACPSDQPLSDVTDIKSANSGIERVLTYLPVPMIRTPPLRAQDWKADTQLGKWLQRFSPNEETVASGRALETATNSLF